MTGRFVAKWLDHSGLMWPAILERGESPGDRRILVSGNYQVAPSLSRDLLLRGQGIPNILLCYLGCEIYWWSPHRNPNYNDKDHLAGCIVSDPDRPIHCLHHRLLCLSQPLMHLKDSHLITSTSLFFIGYHSSSLCLCLWCEIGLSLSVCSQ